VLSGRCSLNRFPRRRLARLFRSLFQKRYFWSSPDIGCRLLFCLLPMFDFYLWLSSPNLALNQKRVLMFWAMRPWHVELILQSKSLDSFLDQMISLWFITFPSLWHAKNLNIAVARQCLQSLLDSTRMDGESGEVMRNMSWKISWNMSWNIEKNLL
jgi:hypothetical protein